MNEKQLKQLIKSYAPAVDLVMDGEKLLLINRTTGALHSFPEGGEMYKIPERKRAEIIQALIKIRGYA